MSMKNLLGIGLLALAALVLLGPLVAEFGLLQTTLMLTASIGLTGLVVAGIHFATE